MVKCRVWRALRVVGQLALAAASVLHPVAVGVAIDALAADFIELLASLARRVRRVVVADALAGCPVPCVIVVASLLLLALHARAEIIVPPGAVRASRRRRAWHDLAYASAQLIIPVEVVWALDRVGCANAHALVRVPDHVPRAVKRDLAHAPALVLVPDLAC